MTADAERCDACHHSTKKHNDLGYCQVFYPARRSYCDCDGTASSGTAIDIAERGYRLMRAFHRSEQKRADAAEAQCAALVVRVEQLIDDNERLRAVTPANHFTEDTA